MQGSTHRAQTLTYAFPCSFSPRVHLEGLQPCARPHSTTFMQEFRLVFDPPDFQMRPPVVGTFVILLLSRLLEIARDLLCTAIDAFPAGSTDARLHDVQRQCVQEVCPPPLPVSSCKAHIMLRLLRNASPPPATLLCPFFGAYLMPMQCQSSLHTTHTT
jgi:hypothetical protein